MGEMKLAPKNGKPNFKILKLCETIVEAAEAHIKNKHHMPTLAAHSDSPDIV